MNLVKVISSSITDGFRNIKFLRMGKSDVREKSQASSFGVDSCPPKDRIAVYSDTEEKGKAVIIGYINKSQIADVGETRLYSEKENGDLSFFLHLKNDGTAEFGGNTKNLVRFQELETAYNNLKTQFNDLVGKWNAFTVSYVPGSPVTVGLPPTLTGSNVSPSTGDISGAKIDEIKTL